MPAKKKAETAKAAAEAEVKTAKAAEKPVKKTAAKKPAEKKTSTVKETVKVQFGGSEYDFSDIKKAVEADYKGKFSGKVKTLEIYIKPEDQAVYYVINSDFSDKVAL